MRVDCYNACECPINSVEYGDTFYFNDTVCMRVNVDVLRSLVNDVAYVRLDTGDVCIASGDTMVILADTKVVANTKDTF